MDATGDITKQNNPNYIMGEFDPSGVYIYIYNCTYIDRYGKWGAKFLAKLLDLMTDTMCGKEWDHIQKLSENQVRLSSQQYSGSWKLIL